VRLEKIPNKFTNIKKNKFKIEYKKK